MLASEMSPDRLVDLERYPMTRLSTREGRAFVDQCRHELAETNVCVLPEFLPADVVAPMAAQADAMTGEHSHYRVHDWNCYISRKDDPSYPVDHPRRRFFDDRSKIIPFDLFGAESPLRHLYFADYMASGVAAILGYPRLYHSDCPYQALGILGFDEGDSSCWHFDVENEFTVTLQLQTAEDGGRFEIVPNIRTAKDENYSGVQRVLDGDRERVRSYALEAGTLTVFRGRDSMHRVTKVAGSRRRLVGVMCFEQTPGVVTSAEMNATIYGPRVAALFGLSSSPENGAP